MIDCHQLITPGFIYIHEYFYRACCLSLILASQEMIKEFHHTLQSVYIFF